MRGVTAIAECLATNARGGYVMASEQSTPTHQAGPRHHPPARRRSETRRIVWQAPNAMGAETRIFVTIGYADDGIRPERGHRPVEIFYNEGYRSGSDLEMLVSDICILLSIMMQHEDVEIGTFTKSLAREQDLRTGDMRFASLIGVLLDELQRPPEWAAGADAVLAAQQQLEADAQMNGKGNKDDGEGKP